MNSPCPCGSALDYSICCAPLHQGAPAGSPEALMRSRYSAFALGRMAYLLDSWAPETRPTSLDPDPDTRWCSLTVISSSETGDIGSVHFRAVSRTGDDWYCLEEQARFQQQPPHWYYLDGEHTVTRLTPGRNDACPCGSGRKFKRCCA